MATIFEKTWQFGFNQQMSATNTGKHGVWFVKAFLKGDILAPLNEGLWLTDHSCDGTTAGTAGDGIDRWGAQGSTTANSGSACSFDSPGDLAGSMRLTGLTGMTTDSVGKFLTISGAADANNNSKTNTPWRIVKYVSATSVDIYNPNASFGDGNNGSIVWQERNAYTFDQSKLVFSATTRSWFVLYNPFLNHYLTIDCVSAAQTQIVLCLSKTAPTGGTTTARPTATDEYGRTSIFNFISNNTGTTVWWWHAALATTGDFTLLGTKGGGSGNIEQAVIVQALADAKAADDYPVVMYLNFSNGTQEALDVGPMNTTTNWFGRRFDGAAVLANLVPLEPSSESLASVFDEIGTSDFVDSRFDDAPVYMFNNTAANYTLKGRLADIRRAPSSMVSGFCEPNPQAPDSVILGDYWFPANAAPVL